MKEKYYEQLLDVITNNPTEIYRNKEGPIPKVFYVGVGKSGSQSICTGLPETAAHWHREEYFERIYDTKILSTQDISLYDFINYIGVKYNFKPLIIESYREPVARIISHISQRIHKGRLEVNSLKEYEEAIKERINRKRIPYSMRWKEHFNVDVMEEFDSKENHFFKELDSVKLLFLKLEDSSNWQRIFKSIGYDFEDVRMHSSSARPFADLYKEVVDNLKLSKRELDEIYDKEIIKALYSKEEIQTFKERWGVGRV